ncbi:metal-dependent transcriptional regulator [Alkaliphilus transvaalensis]|uniref:metal-dependent transcriptional regulator n=1 Tax=Alkaliphilus transvaalensis TaxID=114628 RepID=UPI0009FC4DCB|nr:hypothetical protein [Alkaliphilus transvaalensis]
MSDIAERLGVSKASTNSAMSSLSDKGLMETEKYKEVFLTPAGLNLAKFISIKHQVIQKFFTEVLKIERRQLFNSFHNHFPSSQGRASGFWI